jgi:hypothetical protein
VMPQTVPGRHGLCSREPNQPGFERKHPRLAFSVRLVELAEPNRHVAADDRTPASLDNDHLRVRPGAGTGRSRGSSSSSPSTGTYRTPGSASRCTPRTSQRLQMILMRWSRHNCSCQYRSGRGWLLK